MMRHVAILTRLPTSGWFGSDSRNLYCATQTASSMGSTSLSWALVLLSWLYLLHSAIVSPLVLVGIIVILNALALSLHRLLPLLYASKALTGSIIFDFPLHLCTVTITVWQSWYFTHSTWPNPILVGFVILEFTLFDAHCFVCLNGLPESLDEVILQLLTSFACLSWIQCSWRWTNCLILSQLKLYGWIVLVKLLACLTWLKDIFLWLRHTLVIWLCLFLYDLLFD